MYKYEEKDRFGYDESYELLVPGAKPCPFCGSTRIKTITKERYKYLDANGVIFECLGCGCAKDSIVWPEQQTYEEAYFKCFESWNRRVSDAIYITSAGLDRLPTKTLNALRNGTGG